MLEKLKILEERFNELSKMLIQPDIISDQSKYIKISKEYKDLKTVVDKKNDIKMINITSTTNSEKRYISIPSP